MDDATTSELDSRAGRDAIVDILVRFAGILDRREWGRLGEIFTDDAVAYRDQNEGLSAIERGIRAQLGGCGPSQHLLGNHQIEVDGGTATALTKVRVFHQGLGERAHLSFECMGDYHDELVKIAGGWRIARRRFDVHISFGDRSVLQPG